MSNNNIKFFHLHSGKRHITVGRVLDKDNSRIRFAYSVCNPKDNFSRKFGRDIVQARLEKNKDYSLNVYGTPNDVYEANTMFNVVETLSMNGPWPTCVKKIANEWLYEQMVKEGYDG